MKTEQEIINMINEKKLKVALDIGCGDDSFKLRYRNEDEFDLILGIDVAFDEVTKISDKKYMMNGDGEKLKFNDRTIDYIESKASYLVEWNNGEDMHRVLKDDGEVAFMIYKSDVDDIVRLRKLFGAKIEVSCYFDIDANDWNYDVRGFKNECMKGASRCYYKELKDCEYCEIRLMKQRDEMK